MPATGARRYQDLSSFQMSDGFRGQPRWVIQIWWLVEKFLFRPSPHIANGWRVFLLRRFGARIGHSVIIRPSASVTFPWKLVIGDYCWIGEDVVLYSLGDIRIGAHSVISQRSYLCAGSHDYTDATFRITSEPILIDEECWLATDVFVSPGVEIGRGTVVAARSTVTRSLPSGVIAVGTPARVLRDRLPEDSMPFQEHGAVHTRA